MPGANTCAQEAELASWHQVATPAAAPSLEVRAANQEAVTTSTAACSASLTDVASSTVVPHEAAFTTMCSPG